MGIEAVVGQKFTVASVCLSASVLIQYVESAVVALTLTSAQHMCQCKLTTTPYAVSIDMRKTHVLGLAGQV